MKKLTVNTRKVRISFISIITLLFMFAVSCSNADLTVPSSDESDYIGAENEPNMDELMMAELRQMESRGNFGNPDFDCEGQMYQIKYDTSLGEYTSRLVTFSEAVKTAKSCRWIDVNGSGTSLTAAIDSTTLRAKTLGRDMVLVYIAQGMDYWAAEDETFKTAYTKLINAVTNDGTKIYATSHSWSGHIVMRLLADNPNVTHFAINPAHGNFKDGEKVDDYVDDLQRTKSQTYIMAGTSDLVARYGGGTAWKTSLGIAGYNCVYYGINGNEKKGYINNPKVSLITVEKSGHMIEDMIAHGGFDKIIKLIK